MAIHYDTERQSDLFERKFRGISLDCRFLTILSKAAGLGAFSVRGHIVRILKRLGQTYLLSFVKISTYERVENRKEYQQLCDYQEGLGAWKDDEDHSKVAMSLV